MSPGRSTGHIVISSVLLLMLTGCGGGGGSSTGNGVGDGGSSPLPPPPPPPPPPAANTAPLPVDTNADQTAIVGLPFVLDPTKGGRLFQDPDGDALSYEVSIDTVPEGLTVSGVNILGTPTSPINCTVTVNVSDGRGGTNSQRFFLHVMKNQAPVVVFPNANRLVGINASIDYDALQGGATFRDPENQPLTYQVTIISAPPGFSIQGTRIVGSLHAPGFAKVKIEARDSMGEVTEDSFGFVVPLPIASQPSLPAQSFVYEDAMLPLNNVFTQNFNGRIFSDTTPDDNLITNAGATLGRVLFYDKRLSITNTHACGSCHEQSHGFASSQTFPHGALGIPTQRSPMALSDVRYNNNNRYFSDERSGRLESLASMPIEDRDELGNNMAEVVRRLGATDFYGPLFQSAFGSPEVTGDRITKALAQFLRSLISYQSKFDLAHYSVGSAPQPDPASVLTAQEIRGFEVGIESQCFHCHMTPTFTSPWPANNGLDEVFSDPGAEFGKFRVASLRNVAVSGPYMHDGRFQTLREVIEHYSTGVKMSSALDIGLGGGRSEPFLRNFSEADALALEAFLNSLTDPAFLADPKFSDPFL